MHELSSKPGASYRHSSACMKHMQQSCNVLWHIALQAVPVMTVMHCQSMS